MKGWAEANPEDVNKFAVFQSGYVWSNSGERSNYMAVIFA